MKKLLLVFGVVVLGATTLVAQGLGFGIKGGVNLASQNVSGLGDPDTKSELGFHGGVFVTFMLSEKIGIQPELLYSTFTSTIDFSGAEYEEKFGYMNLPILVRYNINDMFSLHAGPQLNFLMSADGKDDQGNSYDSKDSFKATDFGLAIGAEVDLPMKLGIGVRYVAGLSNISEDGESWENYEFKNNMIQIYLKFRLKK